MSDDRAAAGDGWDGGLAAVDRNLPGTGAGLRLLRLRWPVVRFVRFAG